jgi:hypothetical protein
MPCGHELLELLEAPRSQPLTSIRVGSASGSLRTVPINLMPRWYVPRCPARILSLGDGHLD